MRQRRAEGQRADQQAEGEAAPAAEPGRHQLQRRRVDAGERQPGDDARGDRGAGAGLGEEREVRDRAERRGGAISRSSRTTSARLTRLEARAPATKPTWTPIVIQAAAAGDSAQRSVSSGTIAVAENQVAIDSTTAGAISARKRQRPGAAVGRRAGHAGPAPLPTRSGQPARPAAAGSACLGWREAPARGAGRRCPC